MNNVILNAVLREGVGVRGKLRSIRESNMIPAIIYGSGKEPLAVSVNMSEILKVLKDSKNSIITLKTDKGEEKVIIKEVSKHVVTDKIIHIDFSRVSMDKKIDIKVPIKFLGEPYGVKTQGGVAEYDMRELEIRCLPADIPHEIPIDISALKIGDSIRIKDLKFDKFEIRENPENLIISIISAKEEEVTPQAAAAPEQPEVIEKGKKAEGEGAEAGKEAGKKEEKK